MPWYKVDYVCGLTLKQIEELAAAITDIHSQHFVTPKAFVNVRFEDISTAQVYVGGTLLRTNRIVGQLRGGSRSRESFEELCSKLVRAWNDIVDVPSDEADRSGHKSLHAISIQPNIGAGYEGGFFQPGAGGDQDWVTKNWDELRERASKGDKFSSMVVSNIVDDPNFIQSRQ